jgi:hypothetical protein
VVLGAFADTYLAHAIPDQQLDDEHVHHLHPEMALEHQKGIVGNFIRLLREANDLSEREILEPGNNLIPLLKSGVITNIELQRDLIWQVDKFSKLKLSCSDDFFLEALASNIKGSVISFQTWVKRFDNLKKSILVKDLNRLKSDYQGNFEQISQLENVLNNIIDSETLLKVRSMKIFSCLNSEKPTPIFLGLARSSNSASKLSNIQRPDGSPFATDAERTEAIVSYFENIYRVPTTDTTDYTDCISNFLGENITNHPLVKNSILTPEESEILDRPLLIDELDESVNKCNIRSAPGVDGLSNVFIKKYWMYFRVPLFKYALFCFGSGSLTQNFRSASIKLIPKKGDASVIKNWRPISLLSNLYKIISRAINNRLNTIVNRICSRAQKGFNKYRYTQECLINVIETIQHCQANGVNGALVAVDMAKAFDTLAHGFLREVFKFFNIGPQMIRWLTLLGENRSACIILDDGSYSRNFKLDRGRAQGDNISPNTFNFGEQILILKIELDPNITGVWKSFQIPPYVTSNTNPFFMHECRGETTKNESLADDNTTLMELTEKNLFTLRESLEKFGDISGLRCNYDKTLVIPIGTNTVVPDSSQSQVIGVGYL